MPQRRKLWVQESLKRPRQLEGDGSTETPPQERTPAAQTELSEPAANDGSSDEFQDVHDIYDAMEAECPETALQHTSAADDDSDDFWAKAFDADAEGTCERADYDGKAEDNTQAEAAEADSSSDDDTDSASDSDTDTTDDTDGAACTDDTDGVTVDSEAAAAAGFRFDRNEDVVAID